MDSGLNIVQVNWQNEQTGIWWNETCAMILAQFGLPGGKYTTNTTEECMSFTFNDPKDATLCRLMLSERL